MSLGLGQMLGMGILGQFFGGGENNNEQGLLQQNQQQGQNQGFNLNNMSPGQWANTAIALNSMRLEPDANLATAMRERIASSQESGQAEKTAQWLDAYVTDEYPEGRGDLAKLVRAGVLPPVDAIKSAQEKTTPSSFMEKLHVLQNPEEYGFTLESSEIVAGIKGLIGIASPNAMETKFSLYEQMLEQSGGDPTKIDQTKLSMLGISPDKLPEFRDKLNQIDEFILANPDIYTEEQIRDFKIKIMTGIAPDDGETPAFKTLKLRAESAGLKEGSTEWNNFMLTHGQGDVTDIDIDLSEDKYSDAYAKQLATITTQEDVDFIKNANGAIENIRKLDGVLDILESGKPITGVMADYRLIVSRFMAFFGSDEEMRRATNTQLVQAFLGSDVFPMIKQLGIGARGLDTPAERDFLISVMTGEIKMERDVLIKMTKLRRKYSERMIADYNQKLKDGWFANYTESTQRTLNPIEPPVRESITVTSQDADLINQYR
jgi:hypothetical protein